MPGLNPMGRGGPGLGAGGEGDARLRGPSALFPDSQPETLGPWLPAENRVRGTRHSAPGTAGARAATSSQQHRAWSCVAGDGLRAALGPQLPAAAAAQREGAAGGGAPRDPGASSASVCPSRRASLSLHALAVPRNTSVIQGTVVRQSKNKAQRKRTSLPSFLLLTF